MKHNFKYIVPNLFTSLSLITAIIALKLILKDQVVSASWLIALSMLFDGLDGKLARLLNACSKFGACYDSIADFIAFGIIPGILAYQVGLYKLGFIGVLLSSFFVFSGAYRLIRFTRKNINELGKQNFTGLPIPAAAGLIAAYVIINFYYWQEIFSVDLFALTVLITAVLMISKIEYIAIEKKKKFTRETKFFVVLACISVVIAIKFSYLIFGVWILIYIMYGLVRQLIMTLHKNQASKTTLIRDVVDKNTDSRISVTTKP